jgi:type II secretory pathway pseudopilin PulG
MTFTVARKEQDVMESHLSSGKYPAHAQNGFTYLGVIIAIALLGIGLSVVSEVWIKTAEHQKREQLEWVGQQYVQAIQSYYYANTGTVHFYPTTLDDLLEDKRYLSVKRHIRTLYPDPFSSKVQWRLIPAPGGGIKGVAFDGDDFNLHVARQFVFTPY